MNQVNRKVNIPTYSGNLDIPLLARSDTCGIGIPIYRTLVRSSHIRRLPVGLPSATFRSGNLFGGCYLLESHWGLYCSCPSFLRDLPRRHIQATTQSEHSLLVPYHHQDVGLRLIDHLGKRPFGGFTMRDCRRSIPGFSNV